MGMGTSPSTKLKFTPTCTNKEPRRNDSMQASAAPQSAETVDRQFVEAVAEMIAEPEASNHKECPLACEWSPLMDVWCVIDDGQVHHSMLAIVPRGTSAHEITEGRTVRVCEFDPYLRELTHGSDSPIDHERALLGVAFKELLVSDVPTSVIDKLALVDIPEYCLQTCNCRHFVVVALKLIVQEIGLEPQVASSAKERLFTILHKARGENERHWTATVGSVLGVAVMGGAAAVSGGLLAPATYAVGVAMSSGALAAVLPASRPLITSDNSLEKCWSDKALLRNQPPRA
jgi:hypothetical protein